MFQVPPEEADRLAALVNYGILDTDFEENFDRVTRLAATLFNVPIALISLVDGYRQWFKAHFGLDVRETSRDVSFCTHAILGTEVFEVLDATRDERFAPNPLVVGDPQIRFYAGAPLRTPDGYAVGTMCIVDRVARQPLTAQQRSALQDLSGIVVDLMEARRLRRDSAKVLKRSAEALERIRTVSHELSSDYPKVEQLWTMSSEANAAIETFWATLPEVARAS